MVLATRLEEGTRVFEHREGVGGPRLVGVEDVLFVPIDPEIPRVNVDRIGSTDEFVVGVDGFGLDDVVVPGECLVPAPEADPTNRPSRVVVATAASSYSLLRTGRTSTSETGSTAGSSLVMDASIGTLPPRW